MSIDTFNLDGQTIPIQDGDTIMQAALRAGVYIPHLCYHPDFQPHGSCRVCIVQQHGRTVSACTQPAIKKTEVISEVPEILDQRRALLEMLFVEGNHVCPGCEKSGACQLQALAYHVNMLAPTYRYFYPRRRVDASHPEILIDYNRCILCELCVRASRDVDAKNIFSITGRGADSRLRVNSDSGDLGDTRFSRTDRAASICPVGAILAKHQGYDTALGQRYYDQRGIGPGHESPEDSDA